MLTRPIILGLVGDSAAGKTTMTAGIANILGPERVTVVSSDDYHKYDRHERAEHNFSALHPDCNYLDILETHLSQLRAGEPILKPVYDHRSGTFARPEYVTPRAFVIVEGLLCFATEAMRQVYDARIFLDPPEDLRRVWKMKRDTARRGYTADQVLASLEKREADSRLFIRPQRANADVVVRFRPPAGLRAEQANGHLDARLVLRPTIAHPDLRDVLEHPANGRRPAIRLELGRDEGRPADILEIDGHVSASDAAELEDLIWCHLPDTPSLVPGRIGTYLDGTELRRSDPLALTQLLCAYHMLRASGAERRQ